jgi:hypothetical protein
MIAILTVSGISITFGLQSLRVKTENLNLGSKATVDSTNDDFTLSPPPDFPPFPPNVTLLPSPGPIQFELHANCTKMTLHKGESLTLSVAISSKVDANLTLTVGITENPIEAFLPSGISAVLDATSVNVGSKASVTVRMTLSAEKEVASGTYRLTIAAIQLTNVCTVAQVEPIVVTIQ